MGTHLGDNASQRMSKRQRANLAHLELRGRIWWVVKTVPPSLREAIGTTKLRINLKTSDLRQAQSKRYAALAQVEERLIDARNLHKLDPLVAKAKSIRDYDWEGEGRAHWDEEVLGCPKQFAIDQVIDELEYKVPERELVRFSALARGEYVPVTEYLEKWLRQENIKATTKAEKRKAVTELTAWKSTLTLQETDRKTAGEFVEYLSNSLAPRTVNKYLTGLSSYWGWLLKRGHVKGDNPWHNQRLKPRRLPRDKRQRPFTDEELVTLFESDPSARLRDVMLIAALSGMRLHEIGDLTVGDCANGAFNVRQAKTKAGERIVPIHPQLNQLIQRRCEGKPIGAFLFDELPERQEDALRKRAAPVSQEFGRYTRVLGIAVFVEGSARSLIDFHSFRRWFITRAEQANQPKHIIEAVVGHERGSIALDVYSAGPAVHQLRACVEAVQLPPALSGCLFS